MKPIGNLKDFLKVKQGRSIFRYRLSNTRHLRILVGNKLYREYAETVTKRIRAMHDEICNAKLIATLPEKTWSKIQKRIFQLVSSIQPGERIRVTVLYEIDENFELTIEVRTSIK